MRGLLRDADVLRQRERGLSIEQRVVDDLGAAPQLVRIEHAVRPEHLVRGLVVNVVAAHERFGQRFIAGQVREHTQLDLRIVRGDQDVAGIGDERAADLATDLRADRNVLQIWIAAAETSGGRHRLADLRMDAAGLGIHERG